MTYHRTFSIYMNASTLKDHFLRKPRDPLNLDYLESTTETVKRAISTENSLAQTSVCS